MSENDFLDVDCDLENFSNGEYYYIISSLLSLGDPGFCAEKLFLSFKEGQELDSVLFFFLSEQIFHTPNGTEPKVCFYLGKLDYAFDDIEIYSGLCGSKELDICNQKIDASFILKKLHEQTYPNEFHPVTFLKGIRNIASQKDFESRRDNDLFNFHWDTRLPDGIKHSFQFGRIGSLGTDFSGDYFLVAFPDEEDRLRTQVNSFKVHDNFDSKIDYIQHGVEITHSIISSESIQFYEENMGAGMFVVEDFNVKDRT